jgi:hypothetical protein
MRLAKSPEFNENVGRGARCVLSSTKKRNGIGSDFAFCFFAGTRPVGGVALVDEQCQVLLRRGLLAKC